MIHPELKHQVEEKTRALIRVLDEIQNRERVFHALVDLIKTVWPAASPHHEPRSAVIARLIQEIDMLDIESRDRLFHPQRSQIAMSEASDESNGTGFSFADSDFEEIQDIHEEDHRLSGATTPDALFVPQEDVAENFPLPPSPGYWGEDTVIRDSHQAVVVPVELSLDADISSPPPPPPSPMIMDYTKENGEAPVDSESIQNSPQVGIPADTFVFSPDRLLLPNVASDYLMSLTLDDIEANGVGPLDEHIEANTLDATEFVNIPPLPPTGSEDWHMLENMDWTLFPPDSAEDLWHAETSSVSSALSTELDDQADINSRDLALIHKLDQLLNALAEGTITGVLDQLSDEDQFRCPWGTFKGSCVRTMLEQLTSSDGIIGEEVIDFFSGQMTSLRNDYWIGRQPHLDNLTPQRQALVIVKDDEWSLVEAQFHTSSLIHYKCRGAESSGHDGCPQCDQIIPRVNTLLHGQGKIALHWQQVEEHVRTSPTGDGLWLLWVAQQRTEGSDPSEPMPAGYRLSLARAILCVFKGSYSSSMLLRLPVPDGQTRLEDYWIQFGIQQGFGTELWEGIQLLARHPVDRIDINHASELMQLALSIGAPDVFIQLKDCLRQVRWLLEANDSFPETPGGCFDAVCRHSEGENLATIGVRLGQWKLYQLKRINKKKLVDEIMRTMPAGTDRGALEKAINVKCRMGVYWSHIVDYAGNGDPNILCLLPRTVDIGPPWIEKKFTTTKYRDMSVADWKWVGKLFSKFRPNMVATMDAGFCKDLLYLRAHEGYYPLEQLNDNLILAQPLSSNLFDGILKGRAVSNGQDAKVLSY